MRTRSSVKANALDESQRVHVQQRFKERKTSESKEPLKCAPCREAKERKCAFVEPNSRCDLCVQQKIPCTPKRTAKQHAEQERKVTQFSYIARSAQSRSTGSESPLYLSGTAGTPNLSQYWLLKRKQEVIAAAHAEDPNDIRMTLQRNLGVIGPAEKCENFLEGESQETAKYGSYPTPE